MPAAGFRIKNSPQCPLTDDGKVKAMSHQQELIRSVIQIRESAADLNNSIQGGLNFQSFPRADFSIAVTVTRKLGHVDRAEPKAKHTSPREFVHALVPMRRALVQGQLSKSLCGCKAKSPNRLYVAVAFSEFGK